MLTSASPSHYSTSAISTFIGVGVAVLLFILILVYVYRHGRPSAILRSFDERREARCKFPDIEIAEAAANTESVSEQAKTEEEQQTQQLKEASDLVRKLYRADRLVGHALPNRPHQVNLEEKRDLKPDSEKLRGQKDSFDLAFDPSSYTCGSGKFMADMYR